MRAAASSRNSPAMIALIGPIRKGAGLIDPMRHVGHQVGEEGQRQPFEQDIDAEPQADQNEKRQTERFPERCAEGRGEDVRQGQTRAGEDHGRLKPLPLRRRSS